jgi:hypothetical protein
VFISRLLDMWLSSSRQTLAVQLHPEMSVMKHILSCPHSFLKNAIDELKCVYRSVIW